MASVRTSFAYSLAQRYAQSALRLAAVLILARLVSPSSFGDFAVPYSLFFLLHAAAESGVGAILIRQRPLETSHIAQALRISVAFSAACAALMVLLCLTADFWLEDGDSDLVFALMALGFLGVPHGLVAGSLLRRRMAFGILCIVGIVSAASNLLVAVSLAAAGWGALALGLGALAEIWLRSGMSMFLAYRRGRFRWRYRRSVGSATGPFLRISGGHALSQASHFVAIASVGSGLGAQAAGLFSRGERLIGIIDDLVLGAVSPVVLPALANRRGDARDTAKAFLFKVDAVAVICGVFFCSLAIFAPEAVRVLLGTQWTEAVPIVQVFCLLGIIVPLSMANSKFLVLLNMERRYLTVQLATQITGSILIVALLPLGVLGVIAGVVATRALDALWTTRLLVRALPIEGSDLVALFLRNALVIAGCAGAAALCRFALPVADGFTASAAILMAGGGATVLAALAVVFIIGHPLRPEIMRLAQRLSRQSIWPARSRQ